MTVHAKRYLKSAKYFCGFHITIPVSTFVQNVIGIAHLRSEIKLLLCTGGENQLLQKQLHFRILQNVSVYASVYFLVATLVTPSWKPRLWISNKKQQGRFRSREK